MSWFTEDLRGRQAQYVFARGRRLTHILSYQIAGPGALKERSLCGGMKGCVFIAGRDLDLTSKDDCMEFLTTSHRVIAVRSVQPGQNLWGLEHRSAAYPVCPRCAARYERLEGFVQPQESRRIP